MKIKDIPIAVARELGMEERSLRKAIKAMDADGASLGARNIEGVELENFKRMLRAVLQGPSNPDWFTVRRSLFAALERRQRNN